MSETLEASQKNSYLYITFNYGTSTQKYTNWHSPADVSFTVKPQIDAKIAANTGTFEEQISTIELPFEDAFTLMLAAGDPVAPVYVTVVERSADAIGAADPNDLVLFKGRLSKVIKNYQGRSGSVVVEAVSLKAILQVPLGFTCTQQCVFNFGGFGCGVDLTPIKKTGTLTAIGTDRVATITGVTAPPAIPPTVPAAPAYLNTSYWRDGYIERNGLRIGVRYWISTDATKFLLRDKAPAEWIGQTVTLTPGCDKSRAMCRYRWNNENQFAGLGERMPDYHPNIEEG